MKLTIKQVKKAERCGGPGRTDIGREGVMEEVGYIDAPWLHVLVFLREKNVRAGGDPVQ